MAAAAVAVAVAVVVVVVVVVAAETASVVPPCRCYWGLARTNETVSILMWEGKGGKKSSFDDRPVNCYRRCYWALGSECGEVEAGSGANAGMRRYDGRPFPCRLTFYGAS